ncbi:MAG: hypothetical protein Q7S34_01475 [bacterium]|nr:hypothetical protein [bacterium]
MSEVITHYKPAEPDPLRPVKIDIVVRKKGTMGPYYFFRDKKIEDVPMSSHTLDQKEEMMELVPLDPPIDFPKFPEELRMWLFQTRQGKCMLALASPNGPYHQRIWEKFL